jgi:hypothetical protein
MAGPLQIAMAIVRAIFVLGQIALAVALVVSAVVIRGADGGMIYAIAAALALVGAVGSAVLWLRGSWHVITVALVTALLIPCIAFLLLLTIGNPGW